MGIAPVSIQIGRKEDGVFSIAESIPVRNATGTSKVISVDNYSTVRVTNMGYSENIVYIAFGNSTVVATEDSVPVMPGESEYFDVSTSTHIAILCGDQASSNSSESSSSGSSESSESSESSAESTSSSSNSSSSVSSSSTSVSKSSVSSSSTSSESSTLV